MYGFPFYPPRWWHAGHFPTSSHGSRGTADLELSRLLYVKDWRFAYLILYHGLVDDSIFLSMMMWSLQFDYNLPRYWSHQLPFVYCI